ncbi:hypothetical protein RB195_003068 [Necator americanus]|uniref:Uncharacterized protein n=1 Tax=Necator americanus TaxID=51031 RepID=A0ABR1DM21_NECAM
MISVKVGLLAILTSCVVAHPQFGGLPGGAQPGLLSGAGGAALGGLPLGGLGGLLGSLIPIVNFGITAAGPKQGGNSLHFNIRAG